RELLRVAGKAITAGDRKWIHYAIAHLQILHLGPDLDHFAHELVAEDVTLHHRGNITVVDVKVRAADRRRGDPHDRIPWIEDLRIGDPLHPQVLRTVPAVGLHGLASSAGAWGCECIRSRPPRAGCGRRRRTALCS